MKRIGLALMLAAALLTTGCARRGADAGKPALPMPENTPARQEMTAEPVYQAAEKSGLYYAVRELPPKYRQIVYLHYYEEYSIREIAEIMHLSETAVKTRLLRARQKIKSAMEA